MAYHGILLCFTQSSAIQCVVSHLCGLSVDWLLVLEPHPLSFGMWSKRIEIVWIRAASPVAKSPDLLCDPE